MQEGDLYTGQILPRGWVTKTNSLSQEIVIRDPDFYNFEGQIKKVRRKITNVIPKKKRKKKK